MTCETLIRIFESMRRLYIYITILIPSWTFGQMNINCPDIDLLSIDKYDLRFYKKLNNTELKEIDVNLEADSVGIVNIVLDTEDGFTLDKDNFKKNRTFIDSKNILNWKKCTINFKDKFEFLNGSTKCTFSICNNYLARVERSKLTLHNGKNTWEIYDSKFHSYFFLTISEGKKILIIERTGFIIPINDSLIVCIDGDLYSKSKNSSQSNFFEGLEVNDLLYVKSEINGKVTLRSKLLNHPVINREFDSIYFENGNILARSNAKYQVYDYLLNPWRLNDIRAIYKYDGDYYQILKGNKILIVSNKGKIVPKLNRDRIVCGTVNYYSYSIKNDSLHIEIDGTFTSDTTFKTINRIPKSNSEIVTLADYSNSHSFDDNSFGGLYDLPRNLLIFQSNGLFGLKQFHSTANTFTLTELLPVDCSEIKFLGFHQPLRIKRNGLYSYFQVTSDNQYRSIDKFEKFFARFVLPDKRKGWVDLKGNEYLDQ